MRRFHGWEPTTFTLGDSTWREPEFDAWERAVWRALADYEADRCPGCGQPLAESLWDAAVPAGQRPAWETGYYECRACELLEIAQNRIAERDRRQTEVNGFPVATHHRRWYVARKDTPDLTAP